MILFDDTATLLNNMQQFAVSRNIWTSQIFTDCDLLLVAVLIQVFWTKYFYEPVQIKRAYTQISSYDYQVIQNPTMDKSNFAKYGPKSTIKCLVYAQLRSSIVSFLNKLVVTWRGLTVLLKRLRGKLHNFYLFM